MSKPTYFNCPVAIFKGFLKGHNEALSQATKYAVYGYAVAKGINFIDAAYSLEVNFTDPKEAEKKAFQIFSKYSGAMVGLNSEIVWSFKKKPHLDEFEAIQFLGYMAAKSIIGSARYSKMNNSLFLSRMAGSDKVIAADQLPAEISKWGTRRRLDRLKGALSDYWGFSHYGESTRGWYGGFIPLEELIFQVESNRDKVKAAKRANDAREAKKVAMLRLQQQGPAGSKESAAKRKKEPFT
jgi:hypothetical protein